MVKTTDVKEQATARAEAGGERASGFSGASLQPQGLAGGHEKGAGRTLTPRSATAALWVVWRSQPQAPPAGVRWEQG